MSKSRKTFLITILNLVSLALMHPISEIYYKWILGEPYPNPRIFTAAIIFLVGIATLVFAYFKILKEKKNV